MRQWDDWERRTLLVDPSLWTRILTGLLCGLVALFLLRTWSTSRAEGPVRYEVDLPERLRSGQGFEVDEHERRRQESDSRAIYPTCPADGSGLQPDPIIPVSRSDIDTAVSQAASAQEPWAKTSFAERKRVLKTLLNYILTHQDDIVTACCLDSGKTKIDACFGEILVTAEKLQWTIKHGESALAPSRRPTNLLMCYKNNKVYYEPLGVVAACVSWNYPFHMLVSPVISALFSGNAIVVKPNEQVCWSSLYFTHIVRGALKACGHYPDLVQTITCFPEVADHLTSHPTIKHITFIGSREVARKVAASASSSLTALTVELGGKDPAIVLEDASTVADIHNVASILLRGTFQAAGQNCIGIERVIALPKVHDVLLETVMPIVKAMRVGSVLQDANPPDMGSMISSSSFDRLELLITDAVRCGATLHCGGHRLHHPTYPEGHYFPPTLLSNVTPDMAVAQTELFAPVFLLLRAGDVTEAIHIANSTPYALGASVFGHSRRDVQTCVRGIRAGNVSVNDFGAYYACSMPFGGRDGSGYGRFGGEEGLRGLCNVKSVCEEVWWARWLGLRTTIPTPLRYPVQGKVGWEVCKGVVGTGYAIGVVGRVTAVIGLLRALASRGDRRREGRVEQ